MEDDDGNDIDLDGVLTQLERTIPLVKKAREQARRIEDLENTVRALRQRVAELEAEKRPSSSSSASSAPSSPDCMKCRILEHTFRSDDYSLRMSSPQSSSRTVPMYMENGVDARRPRSSSDEGGVQAYFSQFRRVCSFQPIGNNNPCKKCQATTTREEQRIATTASAAVSTSTTGDMADHGVNSLEDYTIENRDGMAEARSGYRLLTCNDDTCFLEEIHSGLVHFPHLTKLLVKFKWIHSPKTVLLVKKPRELDCTRMLESVARFYIQQGLRVVVEKAIMTPCSAAEESILFDLQALGVVATEKHEIQNLPVDFCVCIGGDGTIIWASHLFPKGCPPFVSIAMGSLGFLSTFSVESSRDALRKVLKEEMVLTLRSRLEAHVIRKTGEETRLETVLNEVVVDRGPHSSIVNLDLFIGSSDTPVTHVQGDGLIISTPTGSTAYSLAAGGSMIHPSIPCVAVTPICPHSLSFRPIVISDTSTIRLVVPEIARSGAYVSFDGRHQIELHQGDELVIKVSEFPVPCVCSQGESLDWFRAIKHGFKWNERTIQKKHDGDIPSAL